MRALAILVLVLGILCAAAPPEVGAGGLTGGNSCVAASQGAGSLAIKSTVAAEVDAPVAGFRAVRVTLRLERSGVLYFDRIALSVPDTFVPNTHVDFLCLFLPHEDNRGSNPSIDALGTRIQGTFGLASGVNYCISDKTISKAEALAPLPVIPGTSTVATMADVTIQALNGPCSP